MTALTRDGVWVLQTGLNLSFALAAHNELQEQGQAYISAHPVIPSSVMHRPEP